MQEVVPVGLAGASVRKQFVIMLCGQGRLLSSVSTCPVASSHDRHWTSFRKARFDLSGGFGPPGKYLQRDFDLSCCPQRSKASRYQHLASHFLTLRSRWHLDGSALRLLHKPPSLPRRPASVKITQIQRRKRERQIAKAPRHLLRDSAAFSSPKRKASGSWS